MAMRLGTLAAVTAAALLTGASFAQAAQLLAVDYNGPYSATEAGFSGISSTEYLDKTIGSYRVQSDGGQTYHSTYSYYAGGAPALTYMPDLFNSSLFSTDRYDAGVPINVTLSGFASNTEYALTFYSYTSDGYSADPMTVDYTKTGVPGTILGTITWNPSVAPTASNPDSTTFNMTSDGSGQLFISAKAQASNGVGVRLNGFTVSEVPEPTSVALLGLGGLAMLRRRR